MKVHHVETIGATVTLLAAVDRAALRGRLSGLLVAVHGASLHGKRAFLVPSESLV